MLSRAMIRDLYGRTEAAKMLSTLAIVMAIAPIAGPMLAGHLLVWYTWHSIFWLLVGIGLLMLVCRISASGNTSRREEEQKVYRPYL